MRLPPPRGFTLIELLVALALMAVMAMLGWRALDTMLRTREQVNAATTLSAGWQTALAQWQTDLDALADDVAPPNAMTVWSAEDGLVRLLRRAPHSGGWVVVAWGATDEGTRWARWQSPLARDREQVSVAWTVAAQRVQTEGVRTVGLAGWTVQTWNGNGWQDSTGTERPTAVRLRLQPAPSSGWSGPIILDWVSPSVAGGKR